jgi:predicted TPR repeat methyltransferase
MTRAELEASAASIERVLEQAPDFANAWFMLAEVRCRLGQNDAAVAAYRKVMEVDPGDVFGAGLRLARLGAAPAPAMPEAYVRGIFDQYAARFESELVDTLGYRAPALLRSAVDAACPAGAFDTMLDLGCGTGLAGAAFRDRVTHLTGVDLSPGMIALAQQKGIYERLATDDIVRFLRAETPRRHALVVAADVFVYFADLGEVCAAVGDAMADGALFAFTVETHPGEGAELRETLRYAHGANHVRAALHGFAIAHMAEVSTRQDGGAPVPGLLVVAHRAG